MNKNNLVAKMIEVLGGSSRGQMGNAPKQHNIRGEPHYLNYATAEEMKHLKDDGGTGEMTQYNIPAFPKGGDDDESNESNSFGGSGQTGNTSNNTGGGPQQQQSDGGNTGGGPQQQDPSPDPSPDLVDSGSDGTFGFSEYSWNPFDDDYEFNLNSLLDTLNIAHGSKEASDLRQQPGETAEEYHARMTGEGSVSEEGDTYGGVTQAPTYEDSQGGIHTTQEGADAADEQFQALTDAQGTATGTLDDFGDTYGEDYFSGLESDYAGSYTGERDTAYNAALQGIYDDFMKKGVWDQGAYDEQLALVDAGVLADTGMVDDFTGTFSTGAQDDYNTWYDNQTEAISNLYGAGNLEGLTNFELGELDMTRYDPTSDDFEFEDFNFLDEFIKIYPDGSSVYTDPSTIADDGDGEGEVEDGTTVSAAPGSMIKKKARSKVPTYTSSPLASGGSSSTH